jgi:hypothetical protein
MERYANLSGKSGVVAYQTGPHSIIVEFNSRSDRYYLYDLSSNRFEDIQEMERRARAGRGLSTYIAQHARDAYAKKGSSLAELA